MKPAPFDYLVPGTVDEALDFLHERGGDAKVLAGGQSLLPMMNFRIMRPDSLVDINEVNQLAYIHQSDQMVSIGAGTRQSHVLASEQVKQACPILIETIPYIGHPAIRNRGTVGGSMAHADPAAELPILATLMDAELIVRSVQRERMLKPGEFFLTYLTTALEADELLVEVRFPVMGPGVGWGFQEITRRHGDFAVAAAAATVSLDGSGRCQGTHVAVGGVGGTPIRAHAVEQAVDNNEPTDSWLAEAAQLVKGEIDPSSDIHASADYRSDVTAVLVRRVLQMAVERVRAG